MEKICEIKNLCKSYPGFKLENLGFCLEEGSITGFVGRNGAGKSTAIKSMLNLVHPDGGEISFFGLDMSKKERQIKQRIGYSSSGVHYYERKRIRDIAAVTSRFYEQWDSRLFDEYIKKFGIDDLKKPVELSEGMKVKFSLAMALSHGARLLILDEPTSGLDPVSRDELLQILSEYIEDGEHSVLFSTHITGDLERAADYITYISYGELFFSGSKDEFVDMFRIVKGGTEELSADLKEKAVGVRTFSTGFEALVKTEDTVAFSSLSIEPATIDEIVVFTSKKGDDYE